MPDKKIAIIGAGASGLMAAIAAARQGASVIALEKLGRAGTKLLATGGGRCNITNQCHFEQFAASYNAPLHFIRPSLAALSPEHLRDFLGACGVETYAESDGCVFPRSQKASTIVEALRCVCAAEGVEIRTRVRATAIQPHADADFCIRTADGSLRAHSVIVACGGAGRPLLGGTTGGFELARMTGHTIEPTGPALTPLLSHDHWLKHCAGVALRDALVFIADAPRTASRGDLVFTHEGISGPAAMNCSGAISRRLRTTQCPVAIRIRCRPEKTADQWRAETLHWHQSAGRQRIVNALAAHVPRRLAAKLCERAGITPSLQAARLSKPQRDTLVRLLDGIPLTISETGDFHQAMVTRGGVSLREVQPRRLESRIVRGLYFCGEVLDVDGPCGGFNLQWAFSSGWLAGTRAAR